MRAKKLSDDLADMKRHWTVIDGELVNDGKGAYATTDREYGDIELLVDYKMLPKGDSGVYLRGTPQVQIWDYTPESKSRAMVQTRVPAACSTTISTLRAATPWCWPISRSASGTTCAFCRPERGPASG